MATSGMYKLKSIYDKGFDDISVKCSMYKMVPISSFTTSQEVQCGNSEMPALMKRHLEILKKLDVIQQRLEDLNIRRLNSSEVKPEKNDQISDKHHWKHMANSQKSVLNGIENLHLLMQSLAGSISDTIVESNHDDNANNAAEEDFLVCAEKQKQIIQMFKILESSFSSVPPLLSDNDCHEVVVKCDPTKPPWVLLPALAFLRQHVAVMCSTRTHSSLHREDSIYTAIDPRITKLFNSKSIPEGDRSDHQLLITIIWRYPEGWEQLGCMTVVQPLTSSPIRGQINLLRYLYRLLPGHSSYEAGSPGAQSLADQLLDQCQCVMRLSTAPVREAEERLERMATPPTSDILQVAVWAAIKASSHKGKHMNPTVAKWFWDFDSKYTYNGVGSANGSVEVDHNPWEDFNNGMRPYKKYAILNILRALRIRPTVYEHPPVMTVEEMLVYVPAKDDEMPLKNLFLQDKKTAKYFLVTARVNAKVVLRDLSSKVPGATSLRFASAESLRAVLGVGPGSVTPLAVINDHGLDKTPCVTVVLDEKVPSCEYVRCHPMVNTATITIRGKDLMFFMQRYRHDPILVAFPDQD